MRSGRRICGGGAEHVWVKQALVEFAVGKKKRWILVIVFGDDKVFYSRSTGGKQKRVIETLGNIKADP